MNRNRAVAQAIESLEARQLLAIDLTVNFQPANVAVPSGTVVDSGKTFANRGNGFTYGWNADNSANTRDRNAVSDQKLDTLIHMQQGGTYTWDLAVENGQYDVTLFGGDASYWGNRIVIAAEGTTVADGTGTSSNPFVGGTKRITVSDGKLTLTNPAGSSNAKINYIQIKSVGATTPPATPSGTTKINFQPQNAAIPSGYTPDFGQSYGSRNGLTYGWSGNNASNARDRNTTSDQRYDTLIHMQQGGSFSWDLAVANGSYDVRIVAGDNDFFGNRFAIAAEGVTVVNQITNTTSRFVEGTARITVTDGKLTLTSASGASNNKINFVEVTPANSAPTTPSVSMSVVNSTAREGGSDGTIRISRSGSTTASMLVEIAISGSADNGSDYDPIYNSILIPAGAASVDVVVHAIDDSRVESTETVALTLVANSGYTLGSSTSGTVSILDNDSSTGPSFSNVSWSNGIAPPVSFSESGRAVVGNDLYIFGGFPSSFQPVKNVYKYSNGTWTRLADMPKAITHAGIAVNGNDVWFVGGYIGKDTGGQTFGTTEVWKFNASSGTWSQGPALPAARAAGGAAILGGQLHFFGGQNTARTSNEITHWTLNLGDTAAGWKAKASMLQSRNHIPTLVQDGKIVVLGGQTGYDDGLTPHDDIFTYDPATDRWTELSLKLPEARTHVHFATMQIGTKIVMIGGEHNHNEFRNTVWSIDLNAMRIDVLNPLPDRRLSPVAVYLNNRLMVIGGYDGSGVKQNAWSGVLV